MLIEAWPIKVRSKPGVLNLTPYCSGCFQGPVTRGRVGSLLSVFIAVEKSRAAQRDAVLIYNPLTEVTSSRGLGPGLELHCTCQQPPEVIDSLPCFSFPGQRSKRTSKSCLLGSHVVPFLSLISPRCRPPWLRCTRSFLHRACSQHSS